jgi:ribosome biogenesis protein SSF1/2
MHLADARRVVLLNYNSETKHIDFRHYNVSVKPVGVSKSIKRVITTEVPDLQGFSDISEYVLRGAYASESDIEDGPESTVTLGQDYIGRNNRKQDQRAIKLVELGPRMELRLVKIQAGLCDGEVLYHDYSTLIPFSYLDGDIVRFGSFGIFCWQYVILSLTRSPFSPYNSQTHT